MIRPSQCKHERYEVREKINCNGKGFCVKQCLDCGRNLYGIKRPIGVVVKPFDELLRQDGQDAESEFYRKQREQKQREFIEQVDQRRMDYAGYLRTEKWRIKRNAVMARDGWTCQACRVRRAEEVHHLTYRHIFDEPLFDLVAVCSPCHRKITEMDKAK